MPQTTFQRREAPTVMLIALDPPLETVCLSSLLDSGLRLLRARQVVPACERIPVIMPKLVLAQTTLPDREAQALVDRCVAVGAKTLWLDPDEDKQRVKERIMAAAMAVVGEIYG
jgi:hypothetical protein